MKIYLAGQGVLYVTAKETNYSKLHMPKYLLQTFWDLRKRNDIRQLLNSCDEFILDSGAFTFMNSGKQVHWKSYVDSYIEFINKYDIKQFIELDLYTLPQVRIGLIIGTAIGNLNSPLGIIDIVVGSIVTAITVLLISKQKIALQPLLYALNSGILVSLELYYTFKSPILYNVITVGVSGLILYTLGIALCKVISISIQRINVFNNPCSFCHATKYNCYKCKYNKHSE